MTSCVPPSIRRRVLTAAVLVTLAACGGGDADDDGASDPIDAAADTIAATTLPVEGAADGAAEAGDATTVDLGGLRACLEGLGMNTALGDEASTGLTPGMMESLGIDAIVTFDKGAGWGGTVEMYRTSEQADLAAAGYADSPFGYEVDQIGDVVVKTTGPASDLTDVAGCIER